MSSDNNAYKAGMMDRSVYGIRSRSMEEVRLDERIVHPQNGDCYMEVDHCFITQDLLDQGEHIKIGGYTGTWRVIKATWLYPPIAAKRMLCFLLQRESNEDKKVYLITNRFGAILNNAVARGFESMIADGWRPASPERLPQEATNDIKKKPKQHER